MTELEGENETCASFQGLRLHGLLDVAALSAALHHVVCRHDILRTHFQQSGAHLFHDIASLPDSPLVTHSIDNLDDVNQEAYVAHVCAAEIARPFDIARGPLVRFIIIRLSESHHVFIHTSHYLVTDGRSQSLFLDELRHSYNTAVRGLPYSLAAPVAQYADYALWQHDWLRSSAADQQLATLCSRLRGIDASSHLTSIRSSDGGHDEGRLRRIQISAERYQRLRRRSQASDATVFMVLLSTFQAAVASVTERTPPPIGVVVSPRISADLATMLGPLLNTVVVTSHTSCDSTISDAIRMTRNECLEAYRYQHIPFDCLVRELNPPRGVEGQKPLYNILFNMLALHKTSVRMDGLEVEPLLVDRPIKVTFDIRVDIYASDGLTAQLTYNSRRIDDATIDSVCLHWNSLLYAAANDAELTIADCKPQHFGGQSMPSTA